MGLLVLVALVASACSGDPASGVGSLGSEAPVSVPLPTTGLAESSPTPAPSPVPTAANESDGEEQDEAGEGAEEAGPEPLRIVAVMGETNVMRFLDGPAVAGAVAQIDAINERGGLLGRPVEIRRFDTESRTSLAQRIADRLERDPPDLLLVSCDVDFVRPVLEKADEMGWITISPCADDIGYSSGAWGARNFTLGAPPDNRGGVAAQSALDRYGSTAMVLRDVTSPEALRFCNSFERSYRELGGIVSYRDQFTYDTLEPLLDRLEERGRQTDVIILCSHVPGGGDATPNIIDQVRLRGFEAPIISGLSVDEASWFGSVPSLQEMTYVTWSSIFGNDPVSEVNDLIQAANANTETPTGGVTTVLGADAVDAWARAVEAVRSADPSSVAASLASLSNEDFLSGSLSFTGGARMDATRTYRVMRISAGQVAVPELVTVTE